MKSKETDVYAPCHIPKAQNCVSMPFGATTLVMDICLLEGRMQSTQGCLHSPAIPGRFSQGFRDLIQHAPGIPIARAHHMGPQSPRITCPGYPVWDSAGEHLYKSGNHGFPHLQGCASRKSPSALLLVSTHFYKKGKPPDIPICKRVLQVLSWTSGPSCS